MSSVYKLKVVNGEFKLVNYLQQDQEERMQKLSKIDLALYDSQNLLNIDPYSVPLKDAPKLSKELQQRTKRNLKGK